MSSSPSRGDLVALLAGELDAATLAQRHGMTEDEVLRLRAAFLDGMRSGAAEPSVRRGRTARLVAVGVVVIATGAFAQLVTFTADQPAQAVQVNGNFTQLRTWIEQKVGAVGTNNITTTGQVSAGGVAVSGNVTTGGSLSFGSTTRQMLNLYNADYGVGVNGGTLYYRTGGQHAWFRAGTHSDTGGNPGGGAVQMLLTDTQLTVNGGITANGSGGNVPNNCVIRQGPVNSYQASCGSGEIAVGGGGRCASLWRLTESLPWGGPSDGDSPGNGSPARAWRAVCQVWGNAAAYSYPQLGVYAICCRQ